MERINKQSVLMEILVLVAFILFYSWVMVNRDREG